MSSSCPGEAGEESNKSEAWFWSPEAYSKLDFIASLLGSLFFGGECANRLFFYFLYLNSS